MKAVFSDLIRFRLEVWNRLFQIGSLAETRSTIRRWRVGSILHKARVNIQITKLEHPVLRSVLLVEWHQLLQFVAYLFG